MLGLPIEKVVALGSGGFGFFMLLLSIRKMRQEMYTPKWAPLILIAVTALTVALYVWLTAAPVNPVLALPLFAIGLVIGAGQGQMTRLYYRGPLVFGKRTTGYLLFWALAYVASLLLTQSGIAAAHALGVLGMMLALGVAVGDNLNLLFRSTRLRRPPVGMPEPSPRVAPPPAVPEAQARPGARPRPTTLPK
jgi:hypothetical protein